MSRIEKMNKKQNLFKSCIVLCVIAISTTPTSVIGAFNPADPAEDNGWQWGLSQDHVDNAWDPTDGDKLSNPGCEDIIIAIVDTGCNVAHEDIPDTRIWRNVNEIFNGQDDDGNQLVDDVYGYDFVNDVGYATIQSVTDPGYDDDGDSVVDTWHGTHIAGIISAMIDNNIGIAGIAQVKLMILRIVDEDKGVDTGDWSAAIDYAIQNGADIISCSNSLEDIGGNNYNFLNNEILWAENEEIVWVNNAGNIEQGDLTTDVNYPANRDSILAVGSSEPTNINPGIHKTPISRWGDKLDIIAPGGTDNDRDEDDIYSTWGPNTNSYSYLAGTSMAAPYVAAVVGLMMSYHPDQTAERYKQIITATAIDITNAPGPRQEILASQGKDEFTGWGEVDAQAAVGYANSIRNQWSENMMIQRDVRGFGEENSPSIAVDSEGYSHIVYVGANGDIFYKSIDPAGRLWKGPIDLETGQGTQGTSSKYPDVYVDPTEKVFVGWIEIGANQDDIYYRVLNAKGQPQGAALKISTSATRKECINILKDKNNAQPMVIFAEDNGAPTGWDISRIFWTAGIGWGSAALVNTNQPQRKPSADIGEFNNMNYYYCAYQENDGNDEEIYVYTNFPNVNPNPWKLTLPDDTLDDLAPNVAILYEDMLVYITWIDSEVIKLYAFDGSVATNPEISYPPTPPSIQDNVGIAVSDIHGQVNLQFPKICVSKIFNSENAPDASDLVQADIIYGVKDPIQNQWNLILSETTVDGRSMTKNLEKILFPYEATNPHALASSQKRSSPGTYWLDTDGNFRLVVVKESEVPKQPGEIGQYKPGGGGQIVVIELWFLSTREKWEETCLVGTGTDPNLAIDSNNNLYIVYIGTDSGIFFKYWKNQHRPPIQEDTFMRITPIGDTGSRPAITTTGGITTILYYNEVQRRYWKIVFNPDTQDIYFNGPEPAIINQAPPTGDFSTKFDPVKEWIYVAWSIEVPYRQSDVMVAVVAKDGTVIQFETGTAVEGSSEPDINPRLSLTSDGVLTIIYERDSSNDIYFNRWHYDPQTGTFVREFPQDICTDNQLQQDDSMEPGLCDDVFIHRRNENKQEANGPSNNHFTHNVFCRQVGGKYSLAYTKITATGEIVITEKDILALPINPALYYSDTPIKGRILVDSNNHVTIVYTGKIHHGAAWDPLHNFYAIFFMKLDNNGEILTVETHISDDPLSDSESPEAVYDNDDFLNVVWQHNTPGGWEIRFCEERDQFR